MPGDGSAMPSKVPKQLNDELHILSDALDIRNDKQEIPERLMRKEFKQIKDKFLQADEVRLVSVRLWAFAEDMYVELNKNAIKNWDLVSIKAWIYMLIFC